MVPEKLPVFRLFPYQEFSQSLIQSTPSSRVQSLALSNRPTSSPATRSGPPREGRDHHRLAHSGRAVSANPGASP